MTSVDRGRICAREQSPQSNSLASCGTVRGQGDPGAIVHACAVPVRPVLGSRQAELSRLWSRIGLDTRPVPESPRPARGLTPSPAQPG